MQRFDGDTIRKIPAIVFLNDSAPSPIRSPRKARSGPAAGEPACAADK